VFFANMIRVLSVLFTSIAVVAVREDMAMREHLVVEVEEDMEMKLVPAKISKAIRKSMRLTADAMKLAEEKQVNAKEMAKEAEQKAKDAKKALDKANKMKAELDVHAEQLEVKKKELEKKMLAEAKANEKLTNAQAELAKLEEKEKAEKAAYDKVQKDYQKMIQEMSEKKRQADEKLKEATMAKAKKTGEVGVLQDQAVANGDIKRKAEEDARKEQAKHEAAMEQCEKQKKAAEKAGKDAAQAQLDLSEAEDDAADAEKEVQKKKEIKESVLAVRNSVQAYYDATDAMTKSMEASLEKMSKEEGDASKKPWDLMREDQTVQSSFKTYNLMVKMFSELFFKQKPIYDVISESIKEIHENAQAAWLLQCDPEEELEDEVAKTGSMAKLNEHCGLGLWKHWELERLYFPRPNATSANATNVTPPVTVTEAEVSPESNEEAATPESNEEAATPESKEEAASPESNEEAASTESNEDSAAPETNEEDIKNAEPAEEEHEPALLQEKDLALVREIRRQRKNQRKIGRVHGL